MRGLQQSGVLAKTVEKSMANQDLSSAADRDFSTDFLAKRRSRRRRRWLGALIVVIAAGSVYWWRTHETVEVAENQDLVVTIAYGDIENAIPAAGTLQPKEVVPIGARASGKLEEILVEVGDFVNEGDIVAQIDAREQELRVRSSELSLQNQENQVEQRRLAMEYAKNNLDRTQMLFEANASTPQELENARNSYESSKTQYDNLLISIEQSKTSLSQEQVQLTYTKVEAPITGTIISVDQKEGATLNASQTAPTIMQIADLTTLTVATEISEADIQAIKEGIQVYFTTLGSGERRWYGTLRKIDPVGSVSNNVVMFNGSFDVDNTDGELYPNMTTQVFFVTSEAKNVLTVPLGALTFIQSDTPNGSPMAGRQGGANADRQAMVEQFRQNGGEITPEMRQRFEQMRSSGGFQGGGGGGFPGGGGRAGGAGGGFPGGGNFPGFGEGSPGQDSGQASLGLAGSIALNEPRRATVQVVLADNTRQTREVVVGATDRVNAEVISGLEEGESVVAGVVQQRVEREENNNNNRNNSNNFRFISGGGGFRPF